MDKFGLSQSEFKKKFGKKKVRPKPQYRNPVPLKSGEQPGEYLLRLRDYQRAHNYKKGWVGQTFKSVFKMWPHDWKKIESMPEADRQFVMEHSR